MYEGPTPLWYPEYLQQKAGAAYNPAQVVWWLEFELKRDGVKGFYLETPPEITDEDDVLEAEMEGADLPKHRQHRQALALGRPSLGIPYATWLRLVMNDGDKNRVRWPTHPTWQVFQLGFASTFVLPPLAENKAQLVRQYKHAGYSRALKRMAVGIMASAQLMLDSDPASVVLGFLAGVMRQAQAARRG